SAGMTLATNTDNSGHFIISAFQNTDLTGSGTLVYLRFEVPDLPGTTSPLDFENYIDPNTIQHPGFRFNAGNPTATTTNGSVMVVGPTPTATSTATATATATNTPTF